MDIERVKPWLIGVISGFYLLAVGPHWYQQSDGALYLLLARALANGESYTLYGQPHAFVPPGFPLLLAGLMAIGLGSYFWMNLSMALMGLATVWFAAQYLHTLGPPRIALMATVLFGMGFVMHRHSVLLLSDVPFAFCVTLGLLGLGRGIKRHWGWISLGTVALLVSCWVRVVGVPIAVAACVGLLLQVERARRRIVWVHTVCLFGGLLLTGFLFLRQYERAQHAAIMPDSYGPVVEVLIRQPLVDWVARPLLNFYETGPQLARMLLGDRVPAPIALLLFWGPVLVGMQVYIRRKAYLGVVSTAGYLGGLLVLRALLSRYLLPVAPLLSLYFVEGIHRLFGWQPATRRQAFRRTLLVLLPIMTIHVVKDIRLIAHMHHPRFLELKPEWADSAQAADRLRQVAKRGERFFGTANARVLAYLSDVPFLDVSFSLLLTWEPGAPELLAFLEQNHVAWIVLDAKPRYLLFRTLQSLVLEKADFEYVFDNRRFRIYRRTSAARSGGDNASDATR